MMTYVLIVIVTWGSSGVATTAPEFATQTLCEDARASLHKQWRWTSLTTVCVLKANP